MAIAFFYVHDFRFYSQVRSERNKAREEVRLLRSRLETAQREMILLKREKHSRESQNSPNNNGSCLREADIVSPHRHKLKDDLHQVGKYCF